MRPVALFGSLELHSSDSWWHVFHFLTHLILVSNVISLLWYPAPAIRSLVIYKSASSEPAGGGVMLTWSSSPLTQPAFIWWRCVRTRALNDSGPHLFVYMLIHVWTCVVAMTAVFIVPCLWHWQQQRACWPDHKYLAIIWFLELSDRSSDRVNSKSRKSLLKWRGDKYLASTLGPLTTGLPIWVNVWINVMYYYYRLVFTSHLWPWIKINPYAPTHCP